MHVDTPPAAFPPASFPDIAVTPHRVCLGWPILRFVVRPSFVNRRALILDAAPRRLGLLYTEALPPGTALALLPPGPCEEHRIVRARVIRATPQSQGGWVLDCDLAEALSAGELRACLR